MIDNEDNPQWWSRAHEVELTADEVELFDPQLAEAMRIPNALRSFAVMPSVIENQTDD